MKSIFKILSEENEYDEKMNNEESEKGSSERDGCIEVDNVNDRVQCMSIHKREVNRRGEDLYGDKYGSWRHEQKNITSRLEKQLKARYELEELIDEQMNMYHVHYNHTLIPTSLKDVSNLLVPRWSPPHELATLAWLGDWRPSSILELLRGMSAHSCFTLSDSSERLLSQLVHEIRIEEAIIDEEFAEIQATCILYLPFSPVHETRSGASAVWCVQDEFKKIEKVITKAQQLRFKALELVVKKVLSQAGAAEFLVAYTGIQDSIHQYAEQQKLRKVLVTVPTKTSGST